MKFALVFCSNKFFISIIQITTLISLQIENFNLDIHQTSEEKSSEAISIRADPTESNVSFYLYYYEERLCYRPFVVSFFFRVDNNHDYYYEWCFRKKLDEIDKQEMKITRKLVGKRPEKRFLLLR